MKRQLRDVTSRVHQAVNSAPEVSRVLRETQNTPFTFRVTDFPLRNPGKLGIPLYEGTTDPSHHLTAFGIAMGRARFSPEERDAGYCQLFVENLRGDALRWFSRLGQSSIGSFYQLSEAFLKHYLMFVQQETSSADLWALAQEPKETLRTFIGRFKKIASRITIPDDAGISALRQALSYAPDLRKELKTNNPRTLEDALHRAMTFAEHEEEELVLTKRYTALKAMPTAKERKAVETDEPRQHFDREYKEKTKEEKGKRAAAFLVDSELLVGQPPSKNVKLMDNDPNAYCDFHLRNGHSTADCRHLADLLLTKYRTGEVNVPSIGNPKKNRGSHAGGSRTNEYRKGAELTASIDLATDGENIDERPPPPANRHLNMIMGGLLGTNDSVRAIQKSSRIATTTKLRASCSDAAGMVGRTTRPVTFGDEDTAGVDFPHNDPLVITLQIADSSVSRILVDTGSTVNLIFRATLVRM